MKAPDRIRATWYASDDAEMPNSTSALTPASKFWNSDRDLVEYIRADLVPDPAAIRESALREASEIAYSECGFGEIQTTDAAVVIYYKILAMIGAGAARK